MKKFNFIPLKGITILFVFLLVFNACEKQELTPLTTTDTSFTKLDTDSKNLFRNFDENLEESLMYPENPEEEKINQLFYHLGKATKSIITDSEYLNLIMDGIKNNYYNQLDILTLATEHPQLLEAINVELRKSLSTAKYDFQIDESDLNSKDWNALAYFKSKMTYNDEKYIPVIHTTRPLVESNTLPLVGIGQQVTATDDIPAWHNNQLILLSKEEASNYEGNILIIGNGVELQEPTNGTKNTGANGNLSKAGSSCLYQKEIKIKGKNYRYERFGDTDVRMFMAGNKNFTYDNLFFSEMKIGNSGWDVSKTQVKNQKTHWMSANAKDFQGPVRRNTTTTGTILLNGNLSLENSEVCFGWYEYDWYAAVKTLSANIPFNKYNVLVLTTFSSEYYNVVIDEFNTLYPNSGDWRAYSNNKARINTRRGL